jgi:uncharacterized membrane protein YhaH (DUF805 family)
MQNLSPIGWALRPLKRYVEFSGRSSRAEFWWFMLFLTVLYFGMFFVLMAVVGTGAASASRSSSAVPALAMMGAFGFAGIFLILFWLAMLLPMLAVQVRRLHDTNRSGWWLGAFYLLYVIYMVLVMGSAFSTLGAANGSTSSIPNVALVAIVALVFFAYSIMLLVFYCLAGTRGANRYGEDSYGADVREVFA